MGVPKGFQDVNRKKRIEALNDINFYRFVYEITYTEEYQKLLQESELNGKVIISDIDVIMSSDKFNKRCFKRVNALTEDDANRKMTEWLESIKEESIIRDYKILEVEANSFYDEVKNKHLLPLIDQTEFDKVREESRKGVK
jgi:hypothetical protein